MKHPTQILLPRSVAQVLFSSRAGLPGSRSADCGVGSIFFSGERCFFLLCCGVAALWDPFQNLSTLQRSHDTFSFSESPAVLEVDTTKNGECHGRVTPCKSPQKHQSNLRPSQSHVTADRAECVVLTNSANMRILSYSQHDIAATFCGCWVKFVEASWSPDFTKEGRTTSHATGRM